MQQKVNAWCSLTKDKVIGPFLFPELTITTNYGMPQNDDDPDFIFLLYAMAHFGCILCESLDRQFLER